MTQRIATIKIEETVSRIVCAALRADDGEILLGTRHYSADMHRAISLRTDGIKFKHRHGNNQGFVDAKGNYLNRQDAYLVALKTNQILFDIDNATANKTLYSENLY